VQHLTLKAVTTVVTDQGVFEAVISSESVDREKDVVVADAMVTALRKWNRPIPLAWNHSTKPEGILGHIEPMTVRNVDGEVVAGGQVDLETKVGQDAWRQFKSRSIGFSFAYMIPDGGYTDRDGGGKHITELDVFEVTATPTPMNNDTRVLSTKAAVDDDDEVSSGAPSGTELRLTLATDPEYRKVHDEFRAMFRPLDDPPDRPREKAAATADEQNSTKAFQPIRFADVEC
jgi:HK97 family phage prohead protease